ncbi:MAG: Ig-like domain-containing protein [Myxococcota bacterium]
MKRLAVFGFVLIAGGCLGEEPRPGDTRVAQVLANVQPTTEENPSLLCGNFKIELDIGEQCDDGNQQTESCRYGLESCVVCDSRCKLIDGSTSLCGDGIVDGFNGEHCDDRNVVTENCPVGQESCFVCGSNCRFVLSVGTAETVTVCGNGELEFGEQCDDGNNDTHDTCTNSCTLNQAPTAAAGVVVSVSPLGQDRILWRSLPASDPEGDNLSYAVVASGDHSVSQLTLASGNVAAIDDEGIYTVTITDGYVGQESITYRVTDTAGNSQDVDVLMSVLPEDSDDFAVNTYTSNNQSNSAITALPNGFAMVWQSWRQDGDANGIYGQRYDVAGHAVGSNFLVNTETLDSQRAPDIAVLSNGGFVVVWESDEQEGEGLRLGIYGQRYDSNGSPVGSEFHVNTHVNNDQRMPVVAGLSHGGFVVIWQSWGQDTNGYGIYGQRYDANGTAVGSEFRVNTYVTNDQQKPAVAALSNNGFVVVWESYLQDSSLAGVYGQRYDANGNAVGSEFQVNTHFVGGQSDPAVAKLFDDGFVVAWQSINGSYVHIYGQRYDTNGNPVGGEFQVNTYVNNSQFQPAIATGPHADFVIVWSSLGQDGDGSGIYGQRYTIESGNIEPIAVEFRVNQSIPENQSDSSVAMLPSGNFMTVWEYGIPDGTGNDISARLFTSAYHLQGSSGPDLLAVGSSWRMLTGGAGNDLFVFDTVTSAGSKQLVTDFVLGQDQLLLQGIDPALLDPNDDATTQAAALAGHVEVAVEDADGDGQLDDTIVRVDSSGGGEFSTPDLTIVLQDLSGVALSDFLSSSSLVMQQ